MAALDLLEKVSMFCVPWLNYHLFKIIDSTVCFQECLKIRACLFSANSSCSLNCVSFLCFLEKKNAGNQMCSCFSCSLCF